MPILMIYLSLYPFRNLFLVFVPLRNCNFGQQPPFRKTSLLVLSPSEHLASDPS